MTKEIYIYGAGGAGRELARQGHPGLGFVQSRLKGAGQRVACPALGQGLRQAGGGGRWGACGIGPGVQAPAQG